MKTCFKSSLPFATIQMEITLTSKIKSLQLVHILTITKRMRYIGHRAIQAAVTSSALQASDFKTQVGILFPPLIITLASSKRPSNALQSK